MNDLNEEQQKAARHRNGPMLVLAGAGSGKTRIVTHRIAYLLDQGVPAAKILAVTFTNKAADEMRYRIHHLRRAFVLTSTFHSLGAKILRESIHHLGYNNNFTIYDSSDSEKLLKECLKELNLGQDRSLVQQNKSWISRAKNDLTPPEDPSQTPIAQKIYSTYQSKLKNCNALDFDDLLYLTVLLLQTVPEAKALYQNRWEYLLIDEYQDTNVAQYQLASYLTEKHQNLFAVGDPDQSIYSWRGARYQNILNFASDFPGAEIIKLEQNYRSTNTILQASNALIAHNERRYEKKLWSALGEGEKILTFQGMDEKQEAYFVIQELEDSPVPLEESAIFYRTNAQSRVFEDLLLKYRIPYTIIGGLSFYERKEIKDTLAYLRMLISDTDLISFLRTINLPKRGLGNTTLEKITKQIPNYPSLFSALQNPDLALGKKQKESLHDYLRLIQHLRSFSKAHSLSELISEILSQTHYFTYLKQDPDTFQDRKENLSELLSKAEEWEKETPNPSLSLFLEELSLRSTPQKDPHAPTLKLMSLHNSKGLEFTQVFLVGLEEDLLPHINSKDSPEEIEEERRLCYVGMTRAKQRLVLTSSLYRHLWGGARLMHASRFLREIPSQYLDPLTPSLFR